MPTKSTQTMKLYDLELSGNCYKIRLLLSFLQKDYELIAVDFLDGEHKRSPLIDLNPFGEIPILVDDRLVLRDSQAILVYLASQYGDATWLPKESAKLAKVMEWLMVAESEIARGPNDARLHDKFGYQVDHQLAIEKSTRILDMIEAHLTDQQWLVGDNLTIADIACFPYIGLGYEGRADIGDRPNIHSWINRIKAMDNFVSMSGL